MSDVLADLAKARAAFQLRAIATIMGAPLPMPGALVMTIGQSGGQAADVLARTPPRATPMLRQRNE